MFYPDYRPSVNKIWAVHMQDTALGGIVLKAKRSVVLNVPDLFLDRHGNPWNPDIEPGDIIYHSPRIGQPATGNTYLPGTFMGIKLWIFTVPELLAIDRSHRDEDLLP